MMWHYLCLEFNFFDLHGVMENVIQFCTVLMTKESL